MNTPIPLHPDDRPKSVRWQQDIDVGRLPFPVLFEILTAVVQRQLRLNDIAGGALDPEQVIIDAALERNKAAEAHLRAVMGLGEGV